MGSKIQDYVSVKNGDCLSKMPTATAEQLNIAKILSKPGDEIDLRKYVAQLQELTACTEDQAVTALYDCENNLERAVELLLDKLRFGNEEEWYTTGKKQSRSKHSTIQDNERTESETSSHLEHIPVSNEKTAPSTRISSHSKDESAIALAEPKTDTFETSRKRDKRRSSAGASKPLSYNKPAERRTDISDAKFRLPTTDGSEFKPRSRFPGSDAWDPYTEYGGWGGEAIEVVNSNASISRGLHEEVVLPDDLLLDAEAQEIKSHPGQPAESDERSIRSDYSPKRTTFPDSDSIFITKASSKTPPAAFTNFPDTPVFIVPEVLPLSPPKWPLKLCGEPCVSFRNILPSGHPTSDLSANDTVNRHPQHAPNCSAKIISEVESQEYSSFVTSSSPAKNKATDFDLPKTGVARSLLENPEPLESKTEVASAKFTTNQFQNTNITQKSAGSLPPQKSQPTPAYASDGSSGQSNFLESSLKSYILDNLPNEMSKLAVSEPPHTMKVSQYNLQASVSQTQSPVSSSFSHAQGGNASSASHSVNKTHLPHMTAHGSLHTPQPTANASQSQQQPAAVPPGMPHFIGQFAPPAYMFNLPGSSGNAPTIFDLDQFQLLQQQQRMLYDMHVQQQTATTAQSLLTSTADSSISSKSNSHSLPGAMGHVTAANAGIRPEMIASAMGHAPQMMPTGHPYFSYPGFVLMNGYSNAFLNQQQQSSHDGAQGQSGASHGTPSITQQQPNNSAQSFGALKPASSNVSGYDDLFDMKYGDPSKQVGFKNSANPNYGSFQGQVPATEVVGSKLSSAVHSTSGVLTQGFNATSGTGQPFSAQFYPPYLTAAAAAVVAAAAASAQQQQQASHAGSAVAGSGNQSNANMASVNNNASQNVNTTGPNPLHQSNGAAQAMVLGSSSSNLHAHHHQRSVLPQQY